MARNSLPRGAPESRRVLLAISKRENSERYSRSLHALRYDLDVDFARRGGGALVVHVRATWGPRERLQVRPAHLVRPLTDNPSPEDAAILALLDGASHRLGNPERFAR